MRGVPSGMISMAARPGGVQQLNAAGKQTIVIASPRGTAPGVNAGKIITAVPRAPGAATQYIVVGSRPGGVAGIPQSLNVTAGAGSRVIRECILIL